MVSELKKKSTEWMECKTRLKQELYAVVEDEVSEDAFESILKDYEHVRNPSKRNRMTLSFRNAMNAWKGPFRETQ